MPSGQDDEDPGVVRVDRASPIPAYVQIEHDLRRLIRASALERMPSETDLGRLYGVSRATVRQGLQQLEQGGIIRRVQGIGTTIIAQSRPSLNLSLFRSVTEQLAESGYRPGVKVISRRCEPPPAAIADALAMTSGQPGLCLHRLVSADDMPISLNISWFPLDRVPDMDLADLDDVSTWGYLREHHAIRIGSSFNEVEIVNAAAAAAELLQLAFGTSVVQLTSLSKDHRGRPIEHSASLWGPQQIRFRFALKA